MQQFWCNARCCWQHLGKHHRCQWLQGKMGKVGGAATAAPLRSVLVLTWRSADLTSLPTDFT